MNSCLNEEISINLKNKFKIVKIIEEFIVIDLYNLTYKIINIKKFNNGISLDIFNNFKLNKKLKNIFYIDNIISFVLIDEKNNIFFYDSKIVKYYKSIHVNYDILNIYYNNSNKNLFIICKDTMFIFDQDNCYQNNLNSFGCKITKIVKDDNLFFIQSKLNRFWIVDFLNYDPGVNYYENSYSYRDVLIDDDEINIIIKKKNGYALIYQYDKILILYYKQLEDNSIKFTDMTNFIYSFNILQIVFLETSIILIYCYNNNNKYSVYLLNHDFQYTGEYMTNDTPDTIYTAIKNNFSIIKTLSQKYLNIKILKN